MTCIAGLIDGKKVWLASDAESTWWGSKHDCGSKVTRKGDALFAWTGRAAVAHAIRYRVSVPKVAESSEEEWLNVTLPDAIRTSLKACGLWDETAGTVRGDGAMIVGWRGRLVSLDSHLAVYPAMRGFIAHGSGGDVAVGALCVSKGSPKVRLAGAINAAIKWSSGVGIKVHIESV